MPPDTADGSVEPMGGGNPLAGVAIAEVITNRDDTNQGRVQLRLPWMPGVEPWARVASGSAGPNRGIYFIPQVGDEVLVAFQHGDVRDPYIVGTLWNAKDLPPGTAPLDPVEKRFIRTPAGHEIVMDDKAKSVTVRTCDGHTIVMDPDAVEVVTKGGTASVRLEASGSVLVKADVKIELKAPSITLDATTLEMKSSASASLNGGGVCEIKAGLVKIN